MTHTASCTRYQSDDTTSPLMHTTPVTYVCCDTMIHPPITDESADTRRLPLHHRHWTHMMTSVLTDDRSAPTFDAGTMMHTEARPRAYLRHEWPRQTTRTTGTGRSGYQGSGTGGADDGSSWTAPPRHAPVIAVPAVFDGGVREGEGGGGGCAVRGIACQRCRTGGQRREGAECELLPSPFYALHRLCPLALRSHAGRLLSLWLFVLRKIQRCRGAGARL